VQKLSPQINRKGSLSELSLFEVEECLQDKNWCSVACNSLNFEQHSGDGESIGSCSHLEKCRVVRTFTADNETIESSGHLENSRHPRTFTADNENIGSSGLLENSRPPRTFMVDNKSIVSSGNLVNCRFPRTFMADNESIESSSHLEISRHPRTFVADNKSTGSSGHLEISQPPRTFTEDNRNIESSGHLANSRLPMTFMVDNESIGSTSYRENCRAPETFTGDNETVVTSYHVSNAQRRHATWADAESLASGGHVSNTVATVMADNERITSRSRLENHRAAFPPIAENENTTSDSNLENAHLFRTDNQSVTSRYHFDSARAPLSSSAAARSFSSREEESYYSTGYYGSEQTNKFYVSEPYSASSCVSMNLSNTPLISTFSTHLRTGTEYRPSDCETTDDVSDLSRYSLMDERSCFAMRGNRKLVYNDNVSWSSMESQPVHSPFAVSVSSRDCTPSLGNTSWLSPNCQSQSHRYFQTQDALSNIVPPVGGNEFNMMPVPRVQPYFHSPSTLDCRQSYAYANQDFDYSSQVWCGSTTSVPTRPQASSESRQFSKWYDGQPLANIVPSWQLQTDFAPAPHFRSGTSSTVQYRSLRRDNVAVAPSSMEPTSYMDGRFIPDDSRDQDGEIGTWIAASLALQ